jgi:putative PIN family toxin of toxin-antitoxin system
VRIVIDTNVLLSAFLWGGTPQRLLERVRSNTVDLVISPELLEEFATVIARAQFAAILARTTRKPAGILEQLRAFAQVVAAPPLSQPVCRDAKDDVVLACARAASADLVVSGDDDLLTLEVFEGIPIVSVAQAVAILPAR